VTLRRLRRPASMKPITGIAGCCARAASGHATAAPPASVMNSRRRMCSLAQRVVPYHIVEKRTLFCIAANWTARRPLGVKTRIRVFGTYVSFRRLRTWRTAHPAYVKEVQ